LLANRLCQKKAMLLPGRVRQKKAMRLHGRVRQQAGSYKAVPAAKGPDCRNSTVGELAREQRWVRLVLCRG
jgi:hypothetical protein